MDRINYIHAADLHLDAPFSGLAAGPAEKLRKAPFEALENLVRLCEERRPDFLLLAGDIYNQEERSIRAQLAMRDACQRLAEIDIPVFIAQGNHDPISSRLQAIKWPSNTTIFGPEAEIARFEKGGELAALVHGASHASDREGRDLAQLFKRKPDEECLQVGVLHCNVDGAVSSDRYAPCSLSELRETGLDAWALGHAHKRAILSQKPFIAYSGNSQGLRPNETGPKGCLVVTASKGADGWICESEFVELGPIHWLTEEIALSENDDLASLRDAMAAKVEAAAADGKEAILTIRITGRSRLDSQLRKPDATDGLLPEIVDPQVWIRKISVETSPFHSEAELLDRDDLLGETGRLAKKLADEPEELSGFAQKALAPLYGSRRWPGVPPQKDNLKELLAKALVLCQDALERG